MDFKKSDSAECLAAQIRRHHPGLLGPSSTKSATKACVVFASAVALAGFFGAAGSFLLGSSATLAVVFYLYRADTRLAEAQHLIDVLAGLSVGRAGIVLRETAGDVERLKLRILPVKDPGRSGTEGDLV